MRIYCQRCIMDNTADGFTVSNGTACNYCEEVDLKNNSNKLYYNENNRQKLLEKIKQDGIGKQYDCIIGISGGADSSWTLHLAKENGLRPLAVHMDNGWNSELAQNNINNLIDKLNVDFYSHVINWAEYRSLMQSFFDADVIDVELLYDNAMIAVNYNLAKKYKIKYIVSGSNNATEGMRMPKNWNWYKYDKKNILSIDRQFQKTKIRTFPFYSTRNFLVDNYLRKIKWIPFLDYFNYEKQDAMDNLSALYNYKQYPYKHYESVFTRFYQGYILPNKFDVDKRKLHLSTLIVNGQMSRLEALRLMEKSAYPSQGELEQDINYFLKKMQWSSSDLKEYIARPERKHSEFRTETENLKKFVALVKTLVPRYVINKIKGNSA